MSRGGWVALITSVAALAGVVWFGPYAHGRYRSGEIIDTPVYAAYVAAITDGHYPYRDVSINYPPLALVPWLAAWRGSESFQTYQTRFRTEMGLLAMLLAASVVLLAATLGRPPERAAIAGVCAAIAPLEIGSVLASRFDLWPTLIVAAALAAVAGGRDATGGVLIGLGIAAKLWPVVLLPAALAVAYRRGAATRAALAAAAASLAGFAPGLLLSPHGVVSAVGAQLRRPLQLESLGASLLISIHRAAGFRLGVVTNAGSQNLSGTGVELTRWATSILTVAALLAALIIGVYACLASASPAEAWISAGACAVLAPVAFGVVASPQFVAWLIPFAVILLTSLDRLRVTSALCIITAWVLTGIEFPARYLDLVFQLAPSTAGIVLARNLLMAAAFVLLLWDLRRIRSRVLTR